VFELVDLLLEFCFSVGASLGVLCFHLSYIRLDGGDVLIVDGVLDIGKSAAKYDSADRLHL
jgi:hypothetical protein